METKKASEIGKLPFLRPKNRDVRPREYLTEKEVDRVIAASKNFGRYPHRDSTMIMLAYRHALRVSELINLKWNCIDFNRALFFVNRLKGSTDSTHPLQGIEIRALRKLKRNSPDAAFIFMTERGGPLTASVFAKILKRAGEIAEIDFPIHPHMLRHSTGYKLVNDSHDIRAIQLYLGHTNIQHTVRYTKLKSRAFDNFWKK